MREGRLRIIGGRWRGRRISVPAFDGVRPTPDRVRETLFNWLQPVIEGARCLDLFAGSGALALEAVSRGAKAVVCVERDHRVADALRAVTAELPAPEIEVQCRDAFDFLDGTGQPFEIVFLDPPFAAGLVPRCLERLVAGGWLAPRGWIYVEAETELTEDALAEGFELIRGKRAGDVCYHLVRSP